MQVIGICARGSATRQWLNMRNCEMIKRGPVDVVVMAGGMPRFDGSVFAELERLAAAGTIRVLDAMVLVKNEEGHEWRVELRDLSEEDRAAVGFIDVGTRGLFDPEDEATLAEGMVPGSAIFALAIEHVWAIGLVNALNDAGAELAIHTRVPAAIVDEAFAALAEVDKD
jgi:hypothetical protein